MGHMFKANYIQSFQVTSLSAASYEEVSLWRLNIRNLKMVHTLKEVIIPLWERKVLDAVVDGHL